MLDYTLEMYQGNNHKILFKILKENDYSPSHFRKSFII